MAHASEMAEVAEVAPLMKVETHYTHCNTEEEVYEHRLQRMWFALGEVLKEKNNDTVIMINNESHRQDLEYMIAEDFADKDIKIVLFDSILEDVNKQLKGQYLAFEFPKKISLLGELLAAAFEKSTEINYAVQFGFICSSKEEINYLKALGMEQAKYGNEISSFMRPEKLRAIEDTEKLREEMKARYKPVYPRWEDVVLDANGRYLFPAKLITGPTDSDMEDCYDLDDDEDFDEGESCDEDYNYFGMESSWDEEEDDDY